MMRFSSLLLLLLLLLPTAWAAEPPVDDGEDVDLRTLMSPLMANAPRYAKQVREYEAEIYLRANVNVLKKNHFLKAVPQMFRFSHGVKDYVIESVSELHYTAPDIYDVKVKAATGTFKKNKGQVGQGMDYIHLNPYNSSLLNGNILSPLTRKGEKWYAYALDSTWVASDGIRRYKISFAPLNCSRQLISGHFVMRFGTWTVDEMSMEGRVEYETFKLRVVMGEEGDEMIVPKEVSLDLRFVFAWNKIVAHYDAVYTYKSLTVVRDVTLGKRQKKHDLTASFTLRTDSTQAISSLSQMAQLRPYPLTTEEERLYQSYRQRMDTLRVVPVQRSKSRVFMGALGDALISNYTINLPNMGSVKCTPLINPFLIGYSKSKGYSYMQKFKYNRLFNNDKLLRIVPRVGYNFTHGEFYWKVDGSYTYNPLHMGVVNFTVGNGNRITRKDMPSEWQYPKDAEVSYFFRDDYVTLTHKMEIANGLLLEVGLLCHRYTMGDRTNMETLLREGLIEEQPDTKYSSFAPRLRVEWTPGMYYYINGKRKINYASNHPTFSIDWERGFRGVMHSTEHYERLEFDLQQEITCSRLKRLSYRLGCGAMTDKRERHFANYVNFARNNLPSGWNDEIGGAFQILEREYYKTSRYVRGHFTYEAPFLLFKHAQKYASFFESERFYTSILVSDELSPYVELGYGVGTPVFDLGLFLGVSNNVANRADWFHGGGFKITFELFNR